MSTRTAARLGWSLFVLSAVLLAGALVLNLGRPQYADLTATTSRHAQRHPVVKPERPVAR